MTARRKTQASDRKEEFLDRSLPCRLGRGDYEEKGVELRKELDLLAIEKSEAKETMAGCKARIAAREGEVSRLGKILRTGQEERLVRCSKVTDYLAGEVRVSRTDTGEVIEHRPLLAHEMQKELVPAEEDGE